MDSESSAEDDEMIMNEMMDEDVSNGENDDYDDDDELEYHVNQLNHPLSRKNDDDTEENCSEIERRDSHTYFLDDHSSEVLQVLKKQYDQKLYLDFTVQTSTLKINVHKCLLAACSPYINTYLQNSIDKNSVHFPDLNPDCVKKIVDWCYTGFIKFSIENVEDFLVAADFLCMDQVFKKCTDFIIKRLSIENCYEIYTLSCSFPACDFKKKVKNYILNHAVSLIKQDLLGVISKIEIVEIIADPVLFITDDDGYPMMDGDQEYRIFQMVQHYIQHHNLPHYWPDLLKDGLRLSIMSEQQLKLIRDKLATLERSEDREVCGKILKDALKCKRVKKAECMMWLKPRKNLERLRYYNSSEQATSYMHEDESEPIPFNDIDCRKRGGGVGRLLFVTGMKVYVREWDGTQVVGCVDITYNDGRVISHGVKEATWRVHEFTLAADEKITSITIRSGYVVDSLTFHTNRERSFGPYGGRGGSEKLLRPKIKNGFLATIKGSTVKSRGFILIRKISFVWGYLKMKIDCEASP